MDVTAIVTFRAQFVRAGVHLGQRRGFASLQKLNQRIDRKRVVEINGERVVVIGQHDPARQPACGTPALNLPVLRRSRRCVCEQADLFARDAPRRAREDKPSVCHAGQKW